jgi:hypothetical protein
MRVEIASSGEVALLQIITEVRKLQFSKAACPISVTLLGTIKEFSPLKAKELCPITFTLLGIVIEAKLEQ